MDVSKNAKPIQITKASGEKMPFSEDKLKQSLIRAGAIENVAQDIIQIVKSRLYSGVSTKKIYRWAFNLLQERSSHLAAKYHLKRAIMELGPSGFPFEQFIGEILSHQGYQTQVGIIVKGQCVNHEIDVIAEKANHHFMVECKYHNQPGTICDVKIPLYIQARFKDVEAAWIKLPGHSTKFHQGWVVTNTHFSKDAIQYGNCAGLKLIGWNYPNGSSLRAQVDELGLYPITCLTTLRKTEKQQLLDKKIVLCKELSNHEKLLTDIGIEANRVKEIMQECKELCAILMLNGKQ